MNANTPEDYLRHEGALRSLARTLVASESTAEDVVQDTWLAALRRPPQGTGPGGDSPGGWLAAAARNVARQIGRADDRRKRRELIAALPERLPAVEEVAERAALHRELVDRVLALDEPYRSSLLLRYFEDLPPRAIARQLGVDVATVNQRLWRGRQRLREALDGRYGGRNAWRGFFVLALGGPEAFLPPAPPLAWLHGVPLKLAAAGFAVSAAILGARLLANPSGERIGRGGDGLPGVERSTDGVADARPPGAERKPVAGVTPVPPVAPVVPVTPGDDVEPRGDAQPPVQPAHAAPTPAREAPRTADLATLSALGYASMDGSLAFARGSRPPGTVRVRAGRTRVGADVKETVERMRENEPMAGFMAGETPQHTVVVEPFDLMITEVTNEQYEAFVRATGARPPYTWSAIAIETERQAWFEQDNEKRRQAKERGLRITGTDKFDPERWWNENWRGHGYAVPPEIAELPVVFVSHDDAAAYARWAGLRLPTEFELQAAVGKADYPWGKRWDADAVAPLGDKPEPVGSRPRGASSDGAFDLVGSVWEWTASPYTAYEGYEPLTVKFERGLMVPLAPFDANHRVLFGGSIHSDALAQRKTVRMPSVRDQRTNALGFRCVASAKRGADLAQVALADARDALADRFEGNLTLVLERWTSARGAAGARLADYAVITGYDHVAFVPARGPVSGDDDATLLGVLSTSVPIAVPELAPGSYVVRRAGGEARFFGVDDVREIGDVELGRVALQPPARGNLRAGSLGVLPGPEIDVLLVDCVLPTAVRGEGLGFLLKLGLAPGTIDRGWSR